MSEPIPRETLRAFTERRDGPALLHLAVQSLALVASATLTARLGAADEPARWIALLLLGISVLSFFPLLHEAGHQTAFASSSLNELGAWMGAIVMLQAPSFFREFHWEHHRSTQDPTRDPEISSAPGLLDDWPRDPITYLALASGQALMVGKLGFTVACALLPRSLWAPMFPFIRPERRTRVAWESRVALALIVSFIALGWMLIPGFAWVLAGWPVAHLLLGFYLMPEHTGLPNEGDQLERTRTVFSTGWLRRLMWNMPFHAEHHAYPGVPYHALPRLHAELGPRLVHTSPGYLRFHVDAFARALRLR